MSSETDFVDLIRVVRHHDPDILAACLMRLRMEGYNTWMMGQYKTLDYGWQPVIARLANKIGEYSTFVFDEWPLIKDYDPWTLGRQEASKFQEVRDGVSV